MNIIIEPIQVKDFADRAKIEELFARKKDTFKILTLDTYPRCRVKFVTLCWPEGKESVYDFRDHVYSEGFDKWRDRTFYKDELWARLYKWVKESRVATKKIEGSIFNRTFEDYPYKNKFDWSLDSRFYMSYALPRNKTAFDRFLVWLNKSYEELGEHFAWDMNNSVPEDSPEAKKYEILFLTIPKKRFDDKTGKLIITRDTAEAEPIINALRKEINDYVPNEGGYKFKKCLSQLNADCNFPFWTFCMSFEIPGVVFPHQDIDYAVGEAAKAWAEICALRVRLIYLTKSPFFFGRVKLHLYTFNTIFKLEKGIDIKDLSFDPREELQRYRDEMLEKYPVLKLEEWNRIYEQD
ncbi:MAG: hypothetical protein LBG61_01355 [Burkholderiales bacterium]|nr:hypothetical protein [Burkholderiales bacterium]